MACCVSRRLSRLCPFSDHVSRRVRKEKETGKRTKISRIAQSGKHLTHPRAGWNWAQLVCTRILKRIRANASKLRNEGVGGPSPLDGQVSCPARFVWRPPERRWLSAGLPAYSRIAAVHLSARGGQGRGSRSFFSILIHVCKLSPAGPPSTLLIKVRGVGFEPTNAFATGS
jgi:hypothetical protein